MTRFWLRTLTHVNKTEAKVPSVKEKLSEVQLLRLRATFHALPSVLFANVNFTHVHTPKLRDTGNQPLRIPDYHSHKCSNRLLLRHITQLLLKKISRFCCLGDVIVVNTTERKPWELNGKCKISFLFNTKTFHVISATLETHTYALFFLFFPIVPETVFVCVI